MGVGESRSKYPSVDRGEWRKGLDKGRAQEGYRWREWETYVDWGRVEKGVDRGECWKCMDRGRAVEGCR